MGDAFSIGALSIEMRKDAYPLEIRMRIAVRVITSNRDMVVMAANGLTKVIMQAG